MSIGFRTGQYVGPSGFPLAVVNTTPLNPSDNISLTDNSFTWEENITSAGSSIISGNVTISSGGALEEIPSTTFLTTNQVVYLPDTNTAVPLYYKHICRFYHYTYGNNPSAQVQVTDSMGNVLSGLAYLVQAVRISKYIYGITVLTNFRNSPGVSYKIQYNRCSSDGSSIYPNWTETLSVTPLFVTGSPSVNLNQYILLGPQADGTYTLNVPAVPTITPITNVLGVSIANSPAYATNSVSNNTVDYKLGVTVTYTITATTSSTFNIMRDYDPATGNLVNNYLTSSTLNTWGAATNFNTGTTVTGVPGITIKVHTDNVLIPNDQAYFQASASYYYVDITAYEAIYLIKPLNDTSDDDWYMSVANGSFRRTMNGNGIEVPVGSGTTWQYSIPEYSNQVFVPYWGQPYIQTQNERPILLDQYNIGLTNIPLFIDPSSVFNSTTSPGFPPTGFISINFNNTVLPPTAITDWDIDNGIITIGQLLSTSDEINVTYLSQQNNYVYQGFVASGNLAQTSNVIQFQELNLNPTPGLGHGIYASGLIATIFARPYYNVTSSGVVNSSTLYHNFTGNPDTQYVTDPSTWYMDHFSGVNLATSHTADSGQALSFHGGSCLTSSNFAFSPTSLTFSNTNTTLLIDGGFEKWSSSSSLTNWTVGLDGGILTKTTSPVYAGSFSAGFTGTGSAVPYFYQSYSAYKNLIGTNVFYGALVWCNTPNQALVEIYDGAGNSFSSTHPGDSQWHFLTVSRTISNNATLLWFVNSMSASSGVTAYWDAAVAYATNGYVTVPYSSGNPLSFGSNNFTVELKASLNSFSGQQNIIGQYADSNDYWNCYVLGSSSGNRLGMQFEGAGSSLGYYVMANSWTPASGTWYTLLYERVGTSGVISINGTPQTLTTISGFGNNSIPTINSTLNIGNVNGSPVSGYIDEVIINNKYAYYPSSYYPRTSMYRYGQVDFELGSVSVGPNSSIEDVEIIDVRSRSGGLNQAGIENINTVQVLQPESQFFWDVGYFDGQAVPADGVIVINVPSSILVENGGPFNKDDIKNRIYKHCALGSYVIIQYI